MSAAKRREKTESGHSDPRKANSPGFPSGKPGLFSFPPGYSASQCDAPMRIGPEATRPRGNIGRRRGSLRENYERSWALAFNRQVIPTEQYPFP